MSLITYKQWKNLIESQKDEIKCPHPEDKEFCRKWKLYIDGKGEMPIYKMKTSIGHYTGLKSSVMLSAYDKKKRSKGKKGSKDDWRKEW